MAIQICAVSGNIKNLFGSNVQDCTVSAHTPAPFLHPDGPALIVGVIGSVTTNSSGEFTLNLIETETVGQRIAVVVDFYDGVSSRRKKTYSLIIPDAATAEFTDLIEADAGTAVINRFPASLITVVPVGNLTSTDAQSALQELQEDIDTRATSADLAIHIADTTTHGTTGNIVGTTDTQTLTNKTLTAPIIATIVNTGTLTLPTSTDTLVGRATTDTLTNKTLTAPVIATIVNTGTLTLPTSTDTLVGRATTDTLTNKTLTLPVIASISNSGTLTLPTGPDTIVARTSTDTLTNKSISGSTNTITNVSLTTGVTGTLPATNGGTGTATYTTGDILYASATNTLSKLPIGTAGQVLTVSSSLPSWAAASGSSGTVTTDLSAGNVTVSSGTTLTHPNLTIDTPHTYTVTGRLLSENHIIVNGTLVVNGTSRIL